MEGAISSGSGFDAEADLTDSDSDALTINEDILVPIVEINEEVPDTNWKVKKKRTRVKRRSDPKHILDQTRILMLSIRVKTYANSCIIMYHFRFL